MRLQKTNQTDLAIQMLKEDGNSEFLPVFEQIYKKQKAINLEYESNILEKRVRQGISNDKAEDVANVLIGKAKEALSGINLESLPEVMKGFEAFHVGNLASSDNTK